MKLGAGSALALGSGGIFCRCGKKDPINGPDTNHQINASVAALKGNNLDSMTRDAIEAVGGMASVVNEGETVFIKPNFVTFPWAQSNNCFHYGECTKPEILIATAEECLKAGAKEVIIGDGSQMPTSMQLFHQSPMKLYLFRKMNRSSVGTSAFHLTINT